MKDLDLWIVDDDFEGAYALKRSIERQALPVQMTHFYNGEDFLNRAMEESPQTAPDVVLLDINMPGLNGLKALQDLHMSARSMHVPVIIFTTSDAESDMRMAYSFGANAYVVKPVKIAELDAFAASLTEFWGRFARLESTG
ncbi:MAG: response regulator [Pseudomonadota bacterium]